MAGATWPCNWGGLWSAVHRPNRPPFRLHWPDAGHFLIPEGPQTSLFGCIPLKQSKQPTSIGYGPKNVCFLKKDNVASRGIWNFPPPQLGCRNFMRYGGFTTVERTRANNRCAACGGDLVGGKAGGFAQNVAPRFRGAPATVRTSVSPAARSGFSPDSQ